MITFEDIQKASSTIDPMNIERYDKKTKKNISKPYATVNQRIKAFRILYPTGCIKTELISDDGDKCMFRASVYADDGSLLGTGTAFELRTSSFINETSYVENCETSSIGRALAMCGIGIDLSIASYEEVANAMENQNKEKTFPKKEENEPVEETLFPNEQFKPVQLSRKAAIQCALDNLTPEQMTQTLESWKIGSIDKATDSQLYAIWNKFNKCEVES